MNQPITVSEKLRKNIILLLSGAELFVLILLLQSLVKSYGFAIGIGIISIILVGIIGFNVYIWRKITEEYILIDEVYIEWNGVRFEWEYITEIRLKKEKEKPMFLILKEIDEYHKIPLRLFADRTEDIIKNIKELDLKIAE